MASPKWQLFNQGLGDFGNAFGEQAIQRQQQEQQLKQALQMLMFQEKLKQISAQKQLEQNMKNYQQFAPLFNGSGTQPLTSQQPVFTQGSPQISGGRRNPINPIDLGGALAQLRQPQVATQTSGQPSPFILSPNSMTSGKPEFVTNPDYEKAHQKQRDKIQANASATRIRQEFINRPEVKEYVSLSSQMNMMDRAYNSWKKTGAPSSANALDQILVNTFGRMVDPGVSVREAEFQRTPENMSFVNKFDSAISRMKQGGQLNNNEREALIWGAKIMANERGKTYQNTLEQYKSLAGDLGVEEKLITRGMKEHADWDTAITADQQPGNPAFSGKTKSGLTYTISK